jgi:hypothetical protein
MICSHLRLDLPSEFFPSGFLTKILYSPIYYSIGATCRVHFVVLDLFILIIPGEEYILTLRYVILPGPLLRSLSPQYP